MAFTIPQWKRHKAAIDDHGMKVICARCQIVLPISLIPGQVVLTKEDRLFIGDDTRAVDCP